MKKILTAALAILATGYVSARPVPPHVRHTPPPAHHIHYQHHHRHHGHAGFLPGLAGGFLGSLVYDAVVRPAPVVVQRPVVVRQPVPVVKQIWIEGKYVDQVQPNGVVVRVWVPGHYETVTVYE